MHMFSRSRAPRACASLLVAAASACSPQAAAPSSAPLSASYQGAELAPQAHVSIDQARATALAARAGDITAQELEREAGGSGLRYSFDIKSSGVTYEVGVDAQTGALLENAAEGANPD